MWHWLSLKNVKLNQKTCTRNAFNKRWTSRLHVFTTRVPNTKHTCRLDRKVQSIILEKVSFFYKFVQIKWSLLLLPLIFKRLHSLKIAFLWRFITTIHAHNVWCVWHILSAQDEYSDCFGHFLQWHFKTLYCEKQIYYKLSTRKNILNNNIKIVFHSLNSLHNLFYTNTCCGELVRWVSQLGKNKALGWGICGGKHTFWMQWFCLSALSVILLHPCNNFPFPSWYYSIIQKHLKDHK